MDRDKQVKKSDRFVYGNDITSATDKVIIYDGDSKSKTLKLDDKYMIIYNGKVSDALSELKR